MRLPGARVQADQAVGEEIVAETVSAIEIAGGHFHRDVNIAQFFVAAERSPRAGVAGIFPGVFLPRFVAELAGMGNRAEGPQSLAGADVEAADVARHVVLGRGCGARGKRRTHHHHVADYDGRRTGADLAGFHHLAVEPFRQFDDAVFAETGNRNARPGVERDQLEAGRDQQNAAVVLAVAPIRQAAILRARSTVAARAFVQAIHPQGLASGGIHGHRIAPVPAVK